MYQTILLHHPNYSSKQFIKFIIIFIIIAKYLGVYLDDNLSWDIHIRELSNKLSRANGIMSKLRHYVPKKRPCYKSTMHYFTLTCRMEVYYGL